VLRQAVARVNPWRRDDLTEDAIEDRGGGVQPSM